LRPGYTIQTYQQLFPEFPFLNGITSLYNPERLVSAVWLPDGRRYQFFYNPYGELARVVLPTGAAIEYDWGRGLSNLLPGDSKFSGPNGGFAVSGGDGYFIYRRVVERRYYPDGGSGGGYEGRTTYGRPDSMLGGYPHLVTTGAIIILTAILATRATSAAPRIL
jgi:hypothetical protein